MNLGKIDRAYNPGDKTVDYLRDVALHLQAAIGPQPPCATVLALIAIITTKTIRYRDGFVVNDLGELSRTLGYAEADVVASAMFDDDERDPVWVRRTRLTSGMEAAVDDQVVSLLNAISSDPLVETIA